GVGGRGTRVASYPSPPYGGIERWQVPAARHEPLADTESVPGGYFVNTEGSRCGGYTIVDGPAGNFATAWNALGGKAVAGPPVTGSWTAGGVGRQVIDGAVLVVTGDRSVVAAPVVPALAAAAPDAYRKALLPPVTEQPGGRRLTGGLTGGLTSGLTSGLTDGLTDGEVRARLTDPAIAAAYLGLPAPGARRLLGDPVGPATTMPDGQVRQ